MSYADIPEDVYRVYQPDTPWHPGAPGWSTAPIPGWGQNPNLLDTHRKAIQGLGCGSGGCCGGCKGAMGATDYSKAQTVAFVLGILVLGAVAVRLAPKR